MLTIVRKKEKFSFHCNNEIFSNMEERNEAIAKLKDLHPTQWCVIYSYLYKESYGQIPINYRKNWFMDNHGRKKVSFNESWVLVRRYKNQYNILRLSELLGCVTFLPMVMIN